MKKVLLGTSALALTSAFATSAGAAEWDVKVGGYMEQHVAYASSDVRGVANTDYDGVDVKQDAEIHFKPSITLDNGLKIGVDIQLEGNTGGDQIDESFLFIKGSFGEVLLGNENSAGYKMTYAAPDVTFLNLNSGSTTAFIPFSGTAGGRTTGADVFRGTLGSTFLENARNNDAARITYFTPRLAGFQLGASYARDGNDDSNAMVNLGPGGTLHDIIDVGANYVNSFGAFDVALSGRWGIASVGGTAAGAGTPGAAVTAGGALVGIPAGGAAPAGSTVILAPTGATAATASRNPTVFGGGLNLGYDFGGGKVTVGGSWAEQNDAGTQDGRSFDAGISYTTGPWGFSFTYFNGENVNNESAAALNAAGQSANDETRQAFLLGASYNLAKGVKLAAFGAYEDFDEEAGDAGGPNVATGDDVDGFIIGTGIKVSF